MTEQQKCIADLFKCIDDITEKAKRRDLSLFRISGIGGCDMYQGCPPICRVRDDLLMKYEDIIYQALKELYLENDFEDISITQLTEKANIGRKTFYLHYSSIDDIVDEIVKKLYDNLKKKYNELYNFVDFNNLFSFLNTYIRTMYFEHKDVISVIIQKDKKLLIIKKIQV